MGATQRLLRFGVFELNLDTEELSKSGSIVKLPPQPFKLLVLLAGQAGQVVTRDDIQEQIWGGATYGDFEHGVNKCINQIRTVLADDADKPLYIETLPRRGYRFLAPVVSKTIGAPRPRVVESDSSERSRAPMLVAGSAGAAALAKELVPIHETAMADVEVATETAIGVASTRKMRRWKLRVVSSLVAGVLVAMALVAGGFYWYSRRPLTPFSAQEWFVAGSKPESYEAGTDSREVFNGHPSACLRSKEPVIQGFGTLMQMFKAREYLGKRVRFRAFAKSEGVDWAGLWMRVDKGKDELTFDNMRGRPIKGTTSWQRYDLVLDVPPDATGIFFGVLLARNGKIWLNGVEFEVVGTDVPTTGGAPPSEQLGEKPKLGFEK